MGVVSKVSRGLGVAGAGLALLMMAAPAGATTPNAVTAVVTGNVGRTTTACNFGANPLPDPTAGPGQIANFNQVAIAGAWLAGTSPWVGTVTLPSGVQACVSEVGGAVLPPA